MDTHLMTNRHKNEIDFTAIAFKWYLYPLLMSLSVKKCVNLI